MKKQKIETQVVRCVVAGKNFDTDESDFVFVSIRIKLNKDGHYNRGKVNAVAKKWADDNFNFQSHIVFTGDDCASVAFASNAFGWKTAAIVEV